MKAVYLIRHRGETYADTYIKRAYLSATKAKKYLKRVQNANVFCSFSMDKIKIHK